MGKNLHGIIKGEPVYYWVYNKKTKEFGGRKPIGKTLVQYMELNNGQFRKKDRMIKINRM